TRPRSRTPAPAAAGAPARPPTTAAAHPIPPAPRQSPPPPRTARAAPSDPATATPSASLSAGPRGSRRPGPGRKPAQTQQTISHGANLCNTQITPETDGVLGPPSPSRRLPGRRRRVRAEPSVGSRREINQIPPKPQDSESRIAADDHKIKIL